MLENDIYPVLDALPKASKSRIVSALAKVDRDINSIKDEPETQQLEVTADYYNTQKKFFNRAFKQFRECQKADEDEEEVLSEIADQVLNWIPALWRVAVEQGREFDRVHQAFQLCVETIQRVEKEGTPPRYNMSPLEGYNPDISIENSNGHTVYGNECMTFPELFAWMRKELRAAAAAHGARRRVHTSETDDGLRKTASAKSKKRKTRE